jgi:hypothetical protein
MKKMKKIHLPTQCHVNMATWLWDNTFVLCFYVALCYRLAQTGKTIYFYIIFNKIFFEKENIILRESVKVN